MSSLFEQVIKWIMIHDQIDQCLLALKTSVILDSNLFGRIFLPYKLCFVFCYVLFYIINVEWFEQKD